MEATSIRLEGIAEPVHTEKIFVEKYAQTDYDSDFDWRKKEKRERKKLKKEKKKSHRSRSGTVDLGNASHDSLSAISVDQKIGHPIEKRKKNMLINESETRTKTPKECLFGTYIQDELTSATTSTSKNRYVSKDPERWVPEAEEGEEAEFPSGATLGMGRKMGPVLVAPYPTRGPPYPSRGGVYHRDRYYQDEYREDGGEVLWRRPYPHDDYYDMENYESSRRGGRLIRGTVSVRGGQGRGDIEYRRSDYFDETATATTAINDVYPPPPLHGYKERGRGGRVAVRGDSGGWDPGYERDYYREDGRGRREGGRGGGVPPPYYYDYDYVDSYRYKEGSSGEGLGGSLEGEVDYEFRRRKAVSGIVPVINSDNMDVVIEAKETEKVKVMINECEGKSTFQPVEEYAHQEEQHHHTTTTLTSESHKQQKLDGNTNEYDKDSKKSILNSGGTWTQEIRKDQTNVGSSTSSVSSIQLEISDQNQKSSSTASATLTKSVMLEQSSAFNSTSTSKGTIENNPDTIVVDMISDDSKLLREEPRKPFSAVLRQTNTNITTTNTSNNTTSTTILLGSRSPSPPAPSSTLSSSHRVASPRASSSSTTTKSAYSGYFVRSSEFNDSDDNEDATSKEKVPPSTGSGTGNTSTTHFKSDKERERDRSKRSSPSPPSRRSSSRDRRKRKKRSRDRSSDRKDKHSKSSKKNDIENDYDEFNRDINRGGKGREKDRSRFEDEGDYMSMAWITEKKKGDKAKRKKAAASLAISTTNTTSNTLVPLSLTPSGLLLPSPTYADSTTSIVAENAYTDPTITNPLSTEVIPVPDSTIIANNTITAAVAISAVQSSSSATENNNKTLINDNNNDISSTSSATTTSMATSYPSSPLQENKQERVHEEVENRFVLIVNDSDDEVKEKEKGEGSNQKQFEGLIISNININYENFTVNVIEKEKETVPITPLKSENILDASNPNSSTITKNEFTMTSDATTAPLSTSSLSTTEKVTSSNEQVEVVGGVTSESITTVVMPGTMSADGQVLVPTLGAMPADPSLSAVAGTTPEQQAAAAAEYQRYYLWYQQQQQQYMQYYSQYYMMQQQQQQPPADPRSTDPAMRRFYGLDDD